ncbi:MAG: response regulator transcription factor [Alphaproteobacteria bacterium]|nr:response regulator transcription factor [Alphaproteobacteria bacterium]
MVGHLLVVDDDKRLRQLLKQYLTQAGFLVSVAEDCIQAQELFQLFIFDAVIMDVMMPHKNGVEYTQELRQKGIQTPILMLTAMGDVASRINGLEAGADDYLPKPFDPKELLLRIKNLMKHQQSFSDTVSFGDFTYIKSKKSLINQNIPVSLTGAEQQLLDILVQSVDSVLTREELAQKLKTDSIRTVDVQITRLRRKIEKDPKHPVWIQSIRGQGYKLVRL